MALLKGKTLNFSNFPTEIKEIIFDYLVTSRTRVISGESLRDITRRLDTYSQILMSVCRNWYNIVANIRQRMGWHHNRATTFYVITNLNIFKWAVTQDLPPLAYETGIVCEIAAASGNHDVLKHAISLGFYCTLKALEVSPFGRNLELVKDLYYNISKYNAYTFGVCDRLVHLGLFNNALKSGDIDIVKWVCSQTGFRISDTSIYYVIYYGNLDVLKWHYATKPFMYSWTIIDTAIKYNHIHIIEWLIEFTLEFIEKGGMIVGRDRDIGCDGYLVRCIHNNNIDVLSMLMDFNIVCNNPVNYDILFRETRISKPLCKLRYLPLFKKIATGERSSSKR